MTPPFESNDPCRCGHLERHHVAARYACPVVIFSETDEPRRCACSRFYSLAGEGE